MGVRYSSRMIGRLVVLQLCMLLAWSGSVSADLGAGLAGIEADTLALMGVDRTTALLLYDVHEIDAAQGLTVREFITRGGTVFALSWFGPVPPSLQGLLGRYYNGYAAAVAALKQSGLSRSVHIALADLVVESADICVRIPAARTCRHSSPRV